MSMERMTRIQIGDMKADAASWRYEWPDFAVIGLADEALALHDDLAAARAALEGLLRRPYHAGECRYFRPVREQAECVDCANGRQRAEREAQAALAQRAAPTPTPAGRGEAT